LPLSAWERSARCSGVSAAEVMIMPAAAEAALEGLRVKERLLHGMERAVLVAKKV
jgi:hypothetical protein